MQSSDLVQPALPVLCYVCEAANTCDAEYCRRCSAPMALAQQALGQTARPKMVAVLGPSGSGKTVYLGMLMDVLSRLPQRLQIIARGAFSIGLQQATVSALASCEFPAKTGTEPERWSWVHCEIHRHDAAEEAPSVAESLAGVAPRKRRVSTTKNPHVELVMPDMAGEAILEEVEHPQTFFVIRSLLRNSAAVLLLIDAAELAQGRRDPDFAAMKILSCLKELELQGGVSRMSRRPVALVFTKVDQAEGCRANPQEFAYVCRGNLAKLPAGISRLCVLCRQRRRLLHVAGSPRRGPPPNSFAGRTTRDHRTVRMAPGKAASRGETMKMAKGTAVVQQAIFTSAKTDRSAGYQILAASPGLAESDRRELAAWGPSHDSLLDTGPDALSVNFFPLPSGSFCVSRTTPAGWEYSGRGGYRIYTHCLIASPEVLWQFANHPLALLSAAMAGGCLEPLDAIPARLEPLELRETTTAGDTGGLARLAAEVGPASLATFVEAALTSVCLAVRGPVPTDCLVGGLLDCLPLDCRTLISFSTGLNLHGGLSICLPFPTTRPSNGGSPIDLA